MGYAHIKTLEEARKVPREAWKVVCNHLLDAHKQGCARLLKQQKGCFVWTGAMFMQIRDVKKVKSVYWVTLSLCHGGEHHAPLGQYFDIFLVPKYAVS
ncbi:hypothetical protein ACFL6I_25030 [candidate division KSB1 bacterium]